MAGKPVGTIYAELDLDTTKFTRAQKTILKEAQVVTTGVEKNYKTLGVKSAAMFNAMRDQAENAYQGIAHSSRATADDIVRAEKAKNAKIKQLNQQQFGDQNKMLTHLKNNWKLYGAAAAAAVGLAVRSSIKQYEEFEVALNRLGNVSDDTLVTMKGRIMDVSPVLGSVTELTKGYYQVMSAGVTEPLKAMELLRISAGVSKESTIEQADAVKGLAALMSTYSDEVESAGAAADLLYATERYGITTVGELTPLIGNLANMSKAVGLHANEMAAAMAQISTTGAGTSQSVTQLQSLLTALSKKFELLPESIKKYGSSIAAVEDLGFEGVLKEIWDATDGNSSALVKMLGRQEAYMALLQLSKNEFKGYEERLVGMTDKVGAFDAAWKRYGLTFRATKEEFLNTIGREAVMLGEELAPALKEVIGDTSEWVGENRGLINSSVVGTIKAMTMAAKAYATVMNAVGGVYKFAATGGVGGALVRGVASVIPEVERVTEEFDNMHDGILTVTSDVEDFGYRSSESLRESVEYGNRLKIEENKLTIRLKIAELEQRKAIAKEQKKIDDDSASEYEKVLKKSISYGEKLKREELALKIRLAKLGNEQTADSLKVDADALAAHNALILSKDQSLAQDRLDITERNAAAKAKAEKTFFEGFKEGLEKSQEEMYTWGEAGADVAKEMTDSMTSSLSDFINPLSDEFLSLSSLVDTVFESMVNAAADAVSRMAVEWAVAEGMSFLQDVMFSHSGTWDMKPDEAGVVVQKGQMIIPREASENIRGTFGSMDALEAFSNSMAGKDLSGPISDAERAGLASAGRTMGLRAATGASLMASGTIDASGFARGMTSPGAMVGYGSAAVTGYATNALGVQSGKVSNIGGLIGQMVGAAAAGKAGAVAGGILGQMVGDLAADIANARDNEDVRDAIETMNPGYFAGRQATRGLQGIGEFGSTTAWGGMDPRGGESTGGGASGGGRGGSGETSSDASGGMGGVLHGGWTSGPLSGYDVKHHGTEVTLNKKEVDVLRSVIGGSNDRQSQSGPQQINIIFDGHTVGTIMVNQINENPEVADAIDIRVAAVA